MNEFHKAANLMEKGWTKGVLHRSDLTRDYYCMVGAHSAASNRRRMHGLRYIVQQNFMDVYVESQTGLHTMTFNDHPSTSKAEAVRMMRDIGDEWDLSLLRNHIKHRFFTWLDSKFSGLPKKPVDLPIIPPNALKPGFRQDRTDFTVDDVLAQGQQFQLRAITTASQLREAIEKDRVLV